MERLRNNILYYVLIIINFYVFPLLMQDTGSGMFVLFLLIPLGCLITSFFYGFKNGFDFLYIGVVIILSLSSIFVYFNDSALPYAIIYILIAMIGNFVALPFRKKRS